MREEPFGQGMMIIRNIDGKAERLDGITDKERTRILMLERLNRRREIYNTAGDWKKLLRLTAHDTRNFRSDKGKQHKREHAAALLGH